MPGVFVLAVDQTEEDLFELWTLVDELGGITSSYPESNVVVSGSWAPKRVEREIGRLNFKYQDRALDLDRQRNGKLSGAGTPQAPDQDALASDRAHYEERWRTEMGSKIIVHYDWLRECGQKGLLVDFEPYRIYPPGQTPATAKGKAPASASTHSYPRDHAHTPSDTETTASSTGSDATLPENLPALSKGKGKAVPRKRSPNPTVRVSPTREKTRRIFMASGTASTPPPAEVDEALSQVAREAGVALPAYVPGMGINLDPPPKWVNSQYACQRPTPLKAAHNQGIVDALALIEQQREFVGDTRSALSHSKALSMIKSYPGDLIAHPEQARYLKGVGPKIAAMILQMAETGHIPEVELIRQDPAIAALKQLTEVYRIGPVAARRLWAQGFRTIDDLVKAGVWSPVGKGKHAISVEEALAIVPDLRTRMVRGEVEYIAGAIRETMEEVYPATESVICGGHRRGKATSSDIDLVFTSRPGSEGEQVLQWQHVQRLLDALAAKGYLKHYISITRHGGNAYLDRMAVAEVVLKLPESPSPERYKSRFRRVDLMFCRREVFGAMLVGWTGSKIFERDLRRRAKELGYKFHSDGLVTRDTEHLVPTATEADVFRLLQLPNMPAAWRNCDA